MHMRDRERQQLFDLANELLDSGTLNMNQIRVRVNKEHPDMDWGTKRATLLEVERERWDIPRAVHMPEEADNPPGEDRPG